MSVIKKVKNNGKVKYYFLGMKVYTKKPKAGKLPLREQLFAAMEKREADNAARKTQNAFYTVRSLWELYGCDDRVLNMMEYVLFVEQTEHPHIYLMYLQVLLERGEEKRCEIGLKYYVSKFGLTEIESFLPLSSFAVRHQIQNDKIKKAAFIFDTMEDNRKHNRFVDWLKGKSLAIVGNSPNIVGSGLGQKIDSRDVVMRINSFALTPELAKDIGTKVNVWIHNGVGPTFTCGNMERDYRWVFMIDDYWHKWQSRVDGRSVDLFLDSLFELCRKKPQGLIYCSPEIYRSLRQASCLRHPSAGLIILYYVYSVLGELAEDDVFAFNDKEQEHGLDLPTPLKLPTSRRTDRFIEEPNSYNFLLNVETSHNFNEELRFRKTFLKKKD